MGHGAVLTGSLAHGLAPRTILRMAEPCFGRDEERDLRSSPMQQVVARGGSRTRAAAYLALTKPRIIELLLVTTLPTMVVAEGGLPPVSLMVWTLLGGALAAGGA